MDYSSYLKTSHWRAKREEVFKRYGKNCYICSSTVEIQIHHKKYYHRGESILYNESVLQLIPLCKKCHFSWHKFHGYKKIPGSRLKRLIQKYKISPSLAIENCFKRQKQILILAKILIV